MAKQKKFIPGPQLITGKELIEMGYRKTTDGHLIASNSKYIWDTSVIPNTIGLAIEKQEAQ